jgi:endonuclease-3
MDVNPFAAFAFHAPTQHVAEDESKIADVSPYLAPAIKRQRCAPTPEAAATVTAVSERVPWPVDSPAIYAPHSSQVSSTVTRLAEYRLIASYRDVSKASVDDFHQFLVGLGTGAEPDVGAPKLGRFWALVACLLSVQCRDTVALLATRDLLRRCAGRGAAGVQALADDELASLVHRCNYCVTKAKNVRAAAAYAVAHDGKVPTSYDGLLALPGVGPKIAHLMRSVAYGEQDAGIVVDTHVFRVATMLGWADAGAALSGAERVRQQLETWVPAEERIAFSLALVGFGQLSRGGRDWSRGFLEHVRLLRGLQEGQEDSSLALAKSIVARLSAPG